MSSQIHDLKVTKEHSGELKKANEKGLIAKVLGQSNSPALTIGTDEGTANALNSMGAKHVDCPVREFVVDEEGCPGHFRVLESPSEALSEAVFEAVRQSRFRPGYMEGVAIPVRMALPATFWSDR